MNITYISTIPSITQAKGRRIPMYHIIGNWKQYFSYYQARDWFTMHGKELAQLAEQTQHGLALCPSFDGIALAQQATKDTRVAIGAQTCSAFTNGAYTGEVSAQSLKELGCEVGIVGHSERREHAGLTNTQIAQQMSQLVAHNISPIVCIGESIQEKERGTTLVFLEEQLEPVLKKLNTVLATQMPIFIAYEPIWSIGTGNVPEREYLEDIFAFIGQYISKRTPLDTKLLYGGSVSANTVTHFTSISAVSGFLVGKASTDFQELKKIVSLI